MFIARGVERFYWKHYSSIIVRLLMNFYGLLTQ